MQVAYLAIATYDSDRRKYRPMLRKCLIASLTVASLTVASLADAQGSATAADAGVPPVRNAARSNDVPAARNSSLSGPQVTRRCCSLKGIVIGGGIGAGIGFALARGVCDASDCTSTYIKYMG